MNRTKTARMKSIVNVFAMIIICNKEKKEKKILMFFHGRRMIARDAIIDIFKI